MCQLIHRNALITLGLFLLLVSTLILIITCTEWLPAYLFTDGFKRADCMVTAVYQPGDTCCDVTLTDTCVKVHPCLAVNVTYVDEDDVLQAGIVFKNYDTYHYQGHDIYAKCSYFHCGISYTSAEEKAAEFVGGFIVGESYQVLYDPLNPTTVFPSRMSASIISIRFVMPLLVLITGLVVLVVGYKKEEEEEEEEAEEREEEGETECEKSTTMGDVVQIIEPRDAGKYDYDNEALETDFVRTTSRPQTAFTLHPPEDLVMGPDALCLPQQVSPESLA